MTKINNLAKEIEQAMTQYTKEITDGLERVKEEEAKLTRDEIKSNAKRKGLELTGDYIKGWRTKKEKSAHIVYNATDYQLTHLLENGHAKVSGGRVQAYPHIAPAEQAMIDRYTKKVEGVIRDGK